MKRVLISLGGLAVAAMVMLAVADASPAAAHGPDCADARDFRHCHDYGKAGDAPHAAPDAAPTIGRTPGDLEWRTVREADVTATVTAALPRQCHRIQLGDEGVAQGRIQAGDDVATISEAVPPRRAEIEVCSEGDARLTLTGFLRYFAAP